MINFDILTEKYVCENRLKIINKNPSIKNILFPGIFSPYDISLLINKYKILKTPPRGNLYSDYIFVGFTPGKMKYYPCETVFLYGPTSKLLIEVLYKLNIFPFFTNYYKDYNSYETFIIKELEFLLSNKDYKIVLLGKYKDYETIKYYFSDKEIIQLNHPSYYLRIGKTDKIFEDYKKELK